MTYFLRAVSKSYPNMSSDEKWNLCRLAVFESFLRLWREYEHNEKGKKKLKHVMELMKTQELHEGGFVNGVQVMTHIGCPMYEQALKDGYESQESFRQLKIHGSIEVRNKNQ